MDLYADHILEHYRNPRNKGIGNRKQATALHTETNASCGDEITVALWIEDYVIRSIRWDGVGCAISQAAMSMLSEEFEGKSTDFVLSTSKDDVIHLLGIPVSPRRLTCALLCLDAMKNALREAKPGKQEML